MSKTENQQETHHSMLLEKDTSRMIWNIAYRTGLDPQYICTQALSTFIQIHDALRRGGSLILKAGDLEYDLTDFLTNKEARFDEFRKATGIDLLSQVVTPMQDLGNLQQDFQDSGVPLKIAKPEFQDKARLITQEVCGMILNSYRGAMDEVQIARVERLDQGVLVVENLKDVVDDWISALGLPKIGPLSSERFSRLMSKTIGVFTQPDGLNVYGTTTLLIHRRMFSPRVTEGKRRQMFAREVLHVAEDSHLPILLFDSLTDILAAESISDGNQTEYARRGRNYACAFESWLLIRSVAGQERFLTAYFEPPAVEWNQSSFRLIEHPLHDFMRQDMGLDESGRSPWDRFCHFAFQNRMIEAYSILQSRYN